MPEQLKLSERLSAMIENCGAATEDDLRWLLLQQPRNERLSDEVLRLLSFRRPVPIRELLTVVLEDGTKLAEVEAFAERLQQNIEMLRDENESLRGEIRSMEDAIDEMERRLGRDK